MTATSKFRRGLSWSAKWHLVDPFASTSQQDISLCGAYLYRTEFTLYRPPPDHGRPLPKHLQLIFEGSKKAAGDCKLCARSAGVEIPEDALARVRALAERWGYGTNTSARFAAELYQALGDDQ